MVPTTLSFTYVDDNGVTRGVTDASANDLIEQLMRLTPQQRGLPLVFGNGPMGRFTEVIGAVTVGMGDYA